MAGAAPSSHLGLFQAPPQLQRQVVAVEADGLGVGTDVPARVHRTRERREVALLQGRQAVERDGGDGVNVAKGEAKVLARTPQLTTELLRAHRPTA